MIVYENIIKNIGVNAEFSKKENMIILFGDNAPDLLKDYCYILDVKDVNCDIKKGQILSIDDNKFEITSVGDIAQKNLIDLGHVTICFNGVEKAILPGTIYVEEKDLPNIDIGSKILIFENN